MGSVATNSEGGLTAELAVTRPQTREQWEQWWQRVDDARLALHHQAVQRPDTELWLRDMIGAYGLDEATCFERAQRLGCPRDLLRQPRTTTPPNPAPARTAPAPAGRGTGIPRRIGDGLIDDLLVDQVIAGTADRHRLNRLEREEVAGRMHARGQGITAISRRLGTSGADAHQLIDTYHTRHAKTGTSAC